MGQRLMATFARNPWTLLTLLTGLSSLVSIFESLASLFGGWGLALLPAAGRSHDGYATATRRLRDGYATVTQRLRDGYATVTRRSRDGYATVARLVYDCDKEARRAATPVRGCYAP